MHFLLWLLWGINILKGSLVVTNNVFSIIFHTSTLRTTPNLWMINTSPNFIKYYINSYTCELDVNNIPCNRASLYIISILYKVKELEFYYLKLFHKINKNNLNFKDYFFTLLSLHSLLILGLFQDLHLRLF